MSKLPTIGTNEKHISRGVRFPLINDELSNLLGKVLTVVDASIIDKVQSKAMKDLIREKFGHTMHDNFWHYCYAKSFERSDRFYQLYVMEGEISFADEDGVFLPVKGHPMPEVPE